jgi:Flp pilus assembly CpaF family ATPase
MQLTSGKYYIGNSDHATIKVDDRSSTVGIVLSVNVTKDNLVLRYINNLLKVRYKGKELCIGDIINVGLNAVFIVGSTSLNLERVLSQENLSETEEALSEDIHWKSGDPVSLQRYVSTALLDALRVSGLDTENLQSAPVREKIQLKLREIVASLAIDPKKEKIDAVTLEKRVFDEVIGLGPLEELLANKKISEIMVNRYDQIYIEDEGNLTLSDVRFSSEKSLLSVIERIVSTVGRRIDTSSPICDARLLDGSRVNAVIDPIALRGACLTIRRFPESAISPKELVGFKAMTAFMNDLLQLFVVVKMNVVISGGTGSGKTTLLNALSSFIPPGDRIVTVEDSAELQLQQPHVIALEARPPNIEGKGAVTIRDLVKNCLRMRPDRIVVGECRGGEALDMLQAMNTGHDGSLTTAHANTPNDMMRRLETMVLMSGVEFPLIAIREQVSSAVHMIVQQTRFSTGRRLITYITRILGVDRDTGNYVTEDLVKFHRKEMSDQGEWKTNHPLLQKASKAFGASESLKEIYKKHNMSKLWKD